MALSLCGCGGHREEPITTSSTPDASTRQLSLDNGLQVVWQEDHRQPLVAIEVRILGGLRGEGRLLGTGVTHFLEHMLFKGTPTRAPGSIDQEVRRYGGSINAFTSHDVTGVNLFVESRYLPDALELLSDILQHAVFPKEEFDKERTVVNSEIQMNLDDPDRELHHVFWATHLTAHPYRHPILGYQELLDHLTVDDMAGLYHAQYIPNNVVIACVGDIDSAKFPDLIRQRFGAWKRGLPYQITMPEEPKPVSIRQSRKEMPVQAAYALIGFPSTGFSHPDVYALDVLASVLGHGQSSRLYQELVRGKRLAHAVGSANYTPADPGSFSIYLRTDPDKLDAAKAATLEALEQIQRDGIAKDELEKAKRQVVADFVFRRQTIEAKADDLAGSLALTGDPNFSSRYVEAIKRVTGQDVQRVAKAYLNPRLITVASIEPPATAPAKAETDTADAPSVVKHRLRNGLTVLIGRQRQLPMATIVVAARGGVRVETEDTQGLSNLTAQLLVKGTKSKTATEIATLVESLGAELKPFSGRDGFGMAMQLLSEDFDTGLGLVREALTESAFAPDELNLQRQLILQELQSREDDVFDVAGRLLRRTLFGQHPYRFDPMGSKESVAQLTSRQCRAFAKQQLVPSNMVVAVFGDMDEQTALKAVEREFGKLPGDAKTTWPPQLDVPAASGVKQVSRTLPKEQTVIFLGFRTTRLTAPDRDAVDVLTAILTGMSGRLFQSVREQHGLSYTLGASHAPGWDTGYLVVYAATRPAERPMVLKTIRQVLEDVVEQGVTADELALAKRFLIGEHRMELQSLMGLSKRATLDELYGLGYDAWSSYERRIEAVGAADVQRAARAYLTLDAYTEAVVGPDAEPNPTPPSKPRPAHAR